MCDRAPADLATNNSLLWKNFELLVDLYKYWFTLFVNANLYSLGIAGAMLSFVLTDLDQQSGFERFGLFLPAGISGLLSYFFYKSIEKQRQVKTEFARMEESESIGDACVPNIGLFIQALAAFSIFQALVSAGCITTAIAPYLISK